MGKEFYLNMWSSLIIFCLVVIMSFAYVLKEDQRKLLMIKFIITILGTAVIGLASVLFYFLKEVN